MSTYLGPHQVGYCQRCGFKYQRAALQEDGYIPHLIVCQTCYEPDHPQDYPAPPRAEGLPDYKPSLVGSVLTAPVLTMNVVSPTEVGMTWTDADGGQALIVEYQIWRSVSGDTATLLETLPVERDQYTTQESVNEYTDDTIDLATDYYTYYVVGVNANGESTRSLSHSIYDPIDAVVLTGDYVDPDIDLSWTAAVPTYPALGGYHLYRSVDGGAYSLLETLADDVLEYLDEDVDRATYEYDYYVTPFDIEGNEGADSNIVNFPVVSSGINGVINITTGPDSLPPFYTGLGVYYIYQTPPLDPPVSGTENSNTTGLMLQRLDVQLNGFGESIFAYVVVITAGAGLDQDAFGTLTVEGYAPVATATAYDYFIQDMGDGYFQTQWQFELPEVAFPSGTYDFTFATP